MGIMVGEFRYWTPCSDSHRKITTFKEDRETGDWVHRTEADALRKAYDALRKAYEALKALHGVEAMRADNLERLNRELIETIESMIGDVRFSEPIPRHPEGGYFHKMCDACTLFVHRGSSSERGKTEDNSRESEGAEGV